MHVEQHNEKLCILLEKFTESGLRQHLIQQKGVAAIVKDEMYETLRAVIEEREMGTLCHLYDGNSISVNTENSTLRISTQETCVSLGGFIQVKNFLADLYPADALALYDDFDNEIVNILNSKWRQGLLVNDDAEIGKDRRQVIRLAVLLAGG